MIAEIICVGTELLLGETINTNASYLSKKLASMGIDCFYQTTVGDNPDRIKKALDIAVKRADVIVFTGGLGPTDDDLTVQTIADNFSEELIFDENSFKTIETFFKTLNRQMHPSNRKQALRPKTALVIPNPKGTAPGIIWDVADKVNNNSPKIILTFPGVPDELYAMWESTAENYLKQYTSEILITKHLKFSGIAEADLAEKVKHLMDNQNPTVAPLVGRGEVRLRIGAKAPDSETAIKIINKTEKEILDLAGEYFWGINDEKIEQNVAKLLKEKKLTVSTAESCTGGLLSSMLTDISGSSKFINLNVVTYSNYAKISMIKVNGDTLDKYGAVSPKVAEEMAKGIRALSESDIGIGITGIAGPTGATELKPVGLVYIGINSNNCTKVHEVRIQSTFDREEIKYRAAQFALQYLRRFLLEQY